MSEDKKPSIFDELNKQIKAAEGAVPDRFTVGGQTFERVKSREEMNAPRKGLYKHPRTGKETEEVLESVVIALAPNSDRLILDGVHYLVNRTYTVPVNVAATMRDMISQTWKHEASTGGAYSYGAGAVRNPRAAAAGVGYAQ